MQKANHYTIIFLFLLTNYGYSQLKIGQNSNSIHQASILELESSDKVFVLTRVSNTEMNAISPLAGAMVYNTNQGCVYQYNGSNWVGLCDSGTFNETMTTLVDNNDGSFSYLNEDNTTVTITKAMLVDNGDGSFSFTNGNGPNINFTGTDNQDANQVNLNAPLDVDGDGNIENTVQEAIEGLATITTDDDISAVDFDGTNLNVTESGTTLSANLSALEESADIAAVQTDVDTNEADADNAIATVQADVDQNESDADSAIALKEDSANKSTDVNLADGTNTLFPTELAVKTYVDTQVGTITTDDDISAVDFDGTNLNVTESGTTLSADLSDLEESADIAAVQADVDTNEADADAAIAAVQADVDLNESDADAAIAANTTNITSNDTDITALQNDKEDSANKSTNTALGTSDVEFPTQNAVKTYVDTQVGTITTDDDISAVDFDGTNLNVTESGTTLSANLSALEESADIAAVQTDVDTNEADADAAIAAVQADVDLNESDADAAIALKEDSANKSTDVNLADGTNTLFPTELAVKTYVDTQVGTITTDDDISAVDFDGTNLNVTESGTTLSADLSDLEESADIAVVQTDVDTNESDADNAIAAVQADVDQNESDADNAIATVQADVDLNESDADSAIALKEDSANKSTDVNLADGTNTLFPTELAVKTYVDTQVGTITTDDDISAVDFDGTNLNVTESGTTLSADLSDLEESADIAAVQADVDTNEADADAAIAAIQSDVDQNESDADSAIALKEDSANKSTDVNLADGTNTLFPTELAVKTYVDTQVGTITTDDDISAVDFDGTNLNVTESGTTLSADLSDLEESADIAAVQADVNTNEADADNAIAAVQADVDQNESDADSAIALKEDSANKSTDVNLADGTNTLFPTELAVKTYVDTQVGTITTDDDISAVDFDGTNLNVTESGTTLSADLSDLEESADIAAVQTDVDTNEADADSAIAAVQADVDLNESDADAAIAANTTNITSNDTDITALQNDKEDSANKSTNTALGTSDVEFPTQNAVKTYVDTQVGTITTDDDISAVDFDGTNLNVTESGTTLSANLSALEESADIAAVQTDVDTNEADADSAIAAVQADVDLNESDADAAIAANTTNIISNDTDITALQNDKEDSANKSTDVNLADGTNTLFPTELAVKTYVDAQVGTIVADDDISAVAFDGTNLNVTESGTTLSADLSALEESADIAAVQTDVDTNEADADAAIAAVQADVDLNESDADAAIAANTTNIISNDTDITALQNDKEDSANKSTDVNLADGTNTLFPTELAVKTYVDTQVGTITTDDDISAVDFDGTNLNVTESGTTLSANLSALEESADIAAVQTDVDTNEADADAAIAAVQADVDLNESDADAAIALKEDSANKSTDVNLADGTNTLFPTELAVKTYVDAQVGTITTDDDVSAVDFDGTNLNVTESGTTLSADLSDLEESADIAVVQTDVDTNESDADNAIAAVQADVDTNEADADNAIAAVQADVDQNESDAVAAIALKEDSANKSTDVNLADGTNTLFPTELAVKTYVDTQVGTITTDDDISAVAFDGTNLNVTESGTTLSADLSDLEESADIAAVQADVDQNESDADNAIAAVQADVDQNESDADSAIALKEDSANKSTDVNLADGTNTLFPTELAVKTYVDTQVGTITTDDDISAVDFDGTNLNVTESGTTLSADLSDLEESADIAAVQTDVDTNEADADNAIATVQADVDQNESDADSAIALKEDSTNKSTDVNLADGTNTLFPTELAVKTYVDTQVGTITTDDDISAVDFDGTNLNVTESGTTLSADLSDLEESADIAAVQTDVDTNEADADAAIAAIQSDVDLNESDADNAIAAVQADVDTNEADADNAIAAVQADVDQNESDADSAIALKEDSANKSTDVNLADGTNTLFPTELAVKTYVDTQVGTITTDDDISAVDFDGTNLNVTESGTTLSADLSDLEESAAIAAVQTDVDTNEADADAAIAAIQSDVDLNESDADNAIAAVQADVDTNEADADNAIAAVQADVDQNESDADSAIALKEDSANKSTDVNLADGTNTLFPTELAVKTYVDTQVGTITTDDDISAVDFDGTNLNVTESGTTLSADLSDLEESADIAAVQTDVDTNEADADNAIAANTAAIAAHNTADGDLDNTNEIQTLSISGNDLTISGTGGNMVTLPSIAGSQGSVFFADTDGSPTENNSQLFWDATNNRLGIGTSSPSHKLQVMGQVRATSFANADGTAGAPSYRFNSDGNTGMFRAATDQLGFSTAGTEALRIDASGNIGIGTTSPDEGLHVADNIRLDGSFEDKDGDAGTAGQILSSTATGTDWVDAPASETITTLSQNTTTGLITYNNETPTAQIANVVGAETNNNISVGANGGAFYESPIKAFGKISTTGSVTRATTGVTATRISTGRYRVTLPTGTVSDADYIIQLTQPGRGGSGNDDPGISYSNQTSTSFEVIIGDNDNGGTDRSRFNSDFMFTILDL